MPSEYQDDELHLFDATPTLNLFTYYLLVLVSFTGLSSLLGITSTLDRRDLNLKEGYNEEHYCVWPKDKRRKECEELMKGTDMPMIEIRDSIFHYIERRICQKSSGKMKKKDRVTSDRPIFRLKRRFEYKFHLVGIQVIMLHFSSQYRGVEDLHLVEVFHVNNYVLHIILGKLTYFLNYFCLYLHQIFSKREKKQTKVG